MVKVIRQGIAEDLVNELGNDLPKFLLHCFVKREQSKEFEEEKAKAKKDGFAVLQVDFAENFTAEYQDEVQSAHWHQKQICVHWYGLEWSW